MTTIFGFSFYIRNSKKYGYELTIKGNGADESSYES